MSSVTLHADVVELVDTLALGASAARRGGSSPLSRTKKITPVLGLFFSIKNQGTVAVIFFAY